MSKVRLKRKIYKDIKIFLTPKVLQNLHPIKLYSFIHFYKIT